MTDIPAGLEHYINGTVYDSSGEKVGKVENVYLSDATGEPEFATVSTGWFGSKVSFVPLGSARVEGDAIHVPHTKDEIKNAPNIEADRHLDEAEEAELFRYYGGGVGRSETTGVPGSDHDVDHDGRLRLRKHL